MKKQGLNNLKRFTDAMNIGLNRASRKARSIRINHDKEESE